jgi:hypothetical protein
VLNVRSIFFHLKHRNTAGGSTPAEIFSMLKKAPINRGLFLF